MPSHDDVVAAILEEIRPDGGEIRLIGRLADPVLGNTTEEVFLFVPDLHLVTAERAQRFGRYGFNHADGQILARVLRRLAGLRAQWDAEGAPKLVTMQLGDFFDLWREFPSGPHLDRIDDEAHGDLRDVLYRGAFRGLPHLKATMLLGNHDTKGGQPLAEISFQLKAFNRSPDNRPFLFATHGDCYDMLELLVPDAIEEFAVYFAGSLTPVNKYPIGEWGRRAREINPPMAQMEQAITRPRHDLTLPAGAPRVEPGAALPERLLRVVADPAAVDHGSFAKHYRAVTHPGAQPLGGGLRLIAQGHTHQATLVLAEPPGAQPLAMMDVGAWIERCQYPLAEGDTVEEPSAQLGVVHGNDARIYQIRIGVA